MPCRSLPAGVSAAVRGPLYDPLDVETRRGPGQLGHSVPDGGELNRANLA